MIAACSSNDCIGQVGVLKLGSRYLRYFNECLGGGGRERTRCTVAFFSAGHDLWPETASMHWLVKM